MYVPDEFYIEGKKLGMAYARLARQQGVNYRLNEPVSEITVTGGKVIGVRIKGDFINASVVIDAAGIWSNLLLEKHNAQVPSAPVRSLYFITKTDDERFPDNHPVCILPDVKAFSRPLNGALLFGIRDSQSAFTHPHHLPRHISDRKYIYSDEIWNVLKKEAFPFCQMIRNSEDIEIEQWVAAPCAYTHDGNPVIGEINQIEGLYVATGCNGGGIAASAGFGRLMAEIVLNEKTFVPADAFSPSRLKNQDPLSKEFMQLCSNQRSQKKSG